MNVNGLVEGPVFVGGLGPDPTGELTALAQTSWVDFGERKLRKGKGGWTGKGGKGKGEEKGKKKEVKRKKMEGNEKRQRGGREEEGK